MEDLTNQQAQTQPAESLLDRMEHIAEEEEEDDDILDDIDEVVDEDDRSIEPRAVFDPYGSSGQASYEEEEENEEDDDGNDDDEEDELDAVIIEEEDDEEEDDEVMPWGTSEDSHRTDDSGSHDMIYGHNSSSLLFDSDEGSQAFSASAGSSAATGLRSSVSTGRRSSFTAPRRQSKGSFGSGGGVSVQSAPTPSSLSPRSSFMQQPRRVTITAPPSSGLAVSNVTNLGDDEEGDMADSGGSSTFLRSSSKTFRRTASRRARRGSVSLKSMSAGAAAVGAGNGGSGFDFDDETSQASGSVNSTPSFGTMLTGRFSRKSARRNSHTKPQGRMRIAENGSVVFDSVDNAVASLGQASNSELENVAAAAAVVAAGLDGKRALHQFGTGDKVLVFLNILNHTNNVDHEENFTVSPVNKFGYPPGEGKTAVQQAGPYVYLLCTVRRVHYDEDVPYYTVAREDTGTEQRADAAWMEHIRDLAGIEAATRVAAQTTRSTADLEPTERDRNGRGVWQELFGLFISWPVQVFVSHVIPFYRRTRATLKKHMTSILYGTSPYACKVRLTGINLLVLCSFVYLFLEVVSLAFLPATADYAVAVIGAVVWSILALELVMEFLIRPHNYFDLIQSDKAYAPSTARNINGYHLFFEFVALCLFVPNFICLHRDSCGSRIALSALDNSIVSIVGPTRWQAAVGRFFIGMRTLRVFGLVRHWKKMWINNTFRNESVRKGVIHNTFLDERELETPGLSRNTKSVFKFNRKKIDDALREGHDDDGGGHRPDKSRGSKKTTTEEDQRLRKAATIGTSLMVINSHRALFIFLVITTILPMIFVIGGVNNVSTEFVDLLQANNLMVTQPTPLGCVFLDDAIAAWISAAATVQSKSWTEEEDVFVLWAQVLPERCPFQNGTQGVVTRCADDAGGASCDVWNDGPSPEQVTTDYFAQELNIREGGIRDFRRSKTLVVNGSTETFSVRVLVNENHSVSFTNWSSFLLLSTALFLILSGLTVLRSDAGRLVLDPLQRMLKIVVLYAQNPLSQTDPRKATKRRLRNKSATDDPEMSTSDLEKDIETKGQLGNFETEQLINAISKIADLLRKCWGVAGADIISSNLAREEDGKTVGFNPTVPGKRVYALFGFVSINDFSEQLRVLDRDVMILINDVAKVVHDEVYRWSLGDSGQCNKNLGASFLMVFRIGDFDEVHERKQRATNMVFTRTKGKRTKTNLRRRLQGQDNARLGRTQKSPRNQTLLRQRAGRAIDGRDTDNDTLQLATLPGIQTFSDRALLGMLKSFAGIHRDRNLKGWKDDFRLGAGVGAFTVNIIIGMDAGWAVEGAVGSEYKIDATYLSPHVNMAARMMSATKQYGVTILVSQAVEELLSRPARSKLRHLDTVYVKGSRVSQRIYTYDARHKGVDFFLFERSQEQSDLDADSYSPNVWETDQDLKAMRQHVTEEFEKMFSEGRQFYLTGKWKEAVKCLKEAENIMIKNVLEEGYIDYNPDDIDGRIFNRESKNEEIIRMRTELGDGACRCLVAYMEKRGAVCPSDWNGVRPLTSK